MAVKVIDFNDKVKRTVEKTYTEGTDTVKYEVEHCLTSFAADGSSDITAMNAQGSVYLDYPAGSTVIEVTSKKLYMLNASETEYKEL